MTEPRTERHCHAEPGRLVYCSWFGDLGGGELRMLDHLRATAFARERVSVMVSQPGRLLQEIAALGIATRLVPWNRGGGYLRRQFAWYAAQLRTWVELRRVRPDLVVCNTFFDYETFGQVAISLRLPLIWRARADTFPQAPSWPVGHLMRLVRQLNEKVDRVLPTTAYEAEMMLAAGVERSRVYVVRNGVDLERYGSVDKGVALRAELGLSREDFVLAFVARMVPQKGYEVFFRALARLKARGVRVRALVAGDTTLFGEGSDAYRKSLRDEVEGLGIAPQVEFLGFRDDVDAVMQAADVFVLASLKEPFGTTVVEAMAAGRPVVASDLPGPRESIVAGQTGLFFPAGDDAALAERLHGLHLDAQHRAEMGRAGRTRAKAEFDLAANIATFDRHCIEVVRERRARRCGAA